MQIFNKHSTKEKRKGLRKNQTEAEMALWQRLRANRFMGRKFFRQYGIGEYIADVYCPRHKLVIEIDGGQHYSSDGSDYDRLREDWMSSLGIRTIRFSNLVADQFMEPGQVLGAGEDGVLGLQPVF